MAKKDDIDLGGGVFNNCLLGVNVNYETTHSEQGIKFRNSGNVCQEFFLEEGRLKEDKEGTGAILPLTSGNINITKFSVNLSGALQQPDDDFQPAVTIFFEITNTDQTKSQFQTTISQRDLDVQY